MARGAIVLLALILLSPSSAWARKKKKPADPYADSKYLSKSTDHETYVFPTAASHNYRIDEPDEADDIRPKKGRKPKHDADSKYLTPAEDLPSSYLYGEDGLPLRKPHARPHRTSGGGAAAVPGARPAGTGRRLKLMNLPETPKRAGAQGAAGSPPAGSGQGPSMGGGPGASTGGGPGAAMGGGPSAPMGR